MIGKIGEEGMATVYKGLQISLNRPVAVKVLSKNVAARAGILERFKKESLIIARLNNPYIIHVIDRGITPEGMPYFVMEYIEGTDLARAIQGGSLDFNRKLELMVQICKAVAYAHKNGVIHRDIKPGNVLIDADGNARMLDFGIAQFYDEDEGDAGHTRPGVIMGTLPYMSPEQMASADNVTMLSDLYSLGVLMYELFTGVKPVGRFKLPGEIDRTIPRPLEEIIMTCMDQEPINRPASGDDIKDRLLKLLQGAHLATAQRERATQGITTNIENKFALLDV
ncbi:MAG: serine/threonine-protein kinase, partial [Pseudomonadota bacterium]